MRERMHSAASVVVIGFHLFVVVLLLSQSLPTRADLVRQSESTLKTTCTAAAAATSAEGDHVHAACSAEEEQRLKSLRERMTISLQKSVDALQRDNSELLHESRDALGPFFARCIDGGNRMLFEKENGIKSKQAISMRSLSKIITSTAAMALQERGLINMSEPIGTLLCEGSAIANATLIQLLSMSAKIMDWRLNAARLAQQTRRNEVPDFVGFPPVCDELGFSPLQCAQDFICPFYRGDPKAFSLAGVTVEEIATAPDHSCEPFDVEARKRCIDRYDHGMMDSDPAVMNDKCRFVLPQSGCKRTVEVSEHKHDDAQTRWHYDYDPKLDKIIKRESPFIYDNYGYTVADAYVTLKTGMSLLDAVKQYVLIPLKMYGTLKCLNSSEIITGVDDYECLSPPTNLEEWFKGQYPPWTKGQMSPAWISNTLFASAEDLTKFVGALLRNGTLLPEDDDGRFLSKASVDTIFTPRITPRRPFGSCIGTQAFGMGMGYCHRRERRALFPNLYVSQRSKIHPGLPGVTMCTTERAWSWGASHGSRISLLRDKSVACLIILNTPNRAIYNSRAHFIGHNMSAILRDSFV